MAVIIRSRLATANGPAYYNFVRIHKALRVTPATAAGVIDKLWDVSEMVKVPEDWEARQLIFVF
jgi:hypothetical protein